MLKSSRRQLRGGQGTVSTQSPSKNVRCFGQNYALPIINMRVGSSMRKKGGVVVM